MNETPTPPEGFRIIPRAYLEAGNPLPGDVVAYNIQPELDDYLRRWGPSLFAGKPVADWAQGHCIYATAQPLPCFQSPDQGQWTEGKHAFPPERVAPEPTAEQARNIEGDFEEPEYARLKAQKDAIVERENERLRDEGRKSVVLIRCINCLSVPRQNKNEITEAECGGCIAKERDAALARIAELERERDEARAEAKLERSNHDYTADRCASALLEIEQLRAQLAALPTAEQRIAELARDNAALWEQLADRDKLVADYCSQLAASAKARQWQPIETAPRDGTYFLAGWFVDEVPDPERFTMTVAFYGQILGNNLLSVPGKYNIGPQVSHWMPLPKAPDAAMKETK